MDNEMLNQILTFLAGLFAGTGVGVTVTLTMGLARWNEFVKTVSTTPVLLSFGEKLAESIPKDVALGLLKNADEINKSLPLMQETMKNSVMLLKELLDGVPADTK